MDFPVELGFAPLPAPSAAGLESSTAGKPAGMGVGFAEIMQAPADDMLATGKPAGAETSRSSQESACVAGDLIRCGQASSAVPLSPDTPLRPATPLSLDTPLSPDTRLHRRMLASGPVITGQQPLADGVTTPRRGPDGDIGTWSLDAPSPDASAIVEAPEERKRERSALTAAEETLRGNEAVAGLPTPTPEPVVTTPREASNGASDRSAEQLSDVPPDTTSIPSRVEAGALPSSQDRDEASLAAAPLHRAQEPAGAESARDAQAPILSDGSGPRPAGRPIKPLAAGEAGRTVEPGQEGKLGNEEHGDGVTRLEKPPEQDPGPDAPARGTERSVSQQPLLSDPHSARPLQPTALHGTGGASPHPLSGAPIDSGLIVNRGPDGAIGATPAHAPHVSFQVTKVVDHDKTAIRIELDPPDLGEVDIDLEFRDLRLTATVRAERSDVLDLLQRDARTLARALREAGVELADSDILFYGGSANHGGQGAAAQRTIALPGAQAAAAPAHILPARFEPREGFVSLSDGRMDLRA